MPGLCGAYGLAASVQSTTYGVKRARDLAITGPASGRIGGWAAARPRRAPGMALRVQGTFRTGPPAAGWESTLRNYRLIFEVVTGLTCRPSVASLNLRDRYLRLGYAG